MCSTLGPVGAAGPAVRFRLRIAGKFTLHAIPLRQHTECSRMWRLERANCASFVRSTSFSHSSRVPQDRPMFQAKVLRGHATTSKDHSKEAVWLVSISGVFLTQRPGLKELVLIHRLSKMVCGSHWCIRRCQTLACLSEGTHVLHIHIHICSESPHGSKWVEGLKANHHTPNWVDFIDLPLAK